MNPNNKCRSEIIDISQIYEKIKKDQELIYKNVHNCIVKDIHYDDAPNVYITIFFDNKEIQTTSSNLKINNVKKTIFKLI